jgi:hypothetical protein
MCIEPSSFGPQPIEMLHHDRLPHPGRRFASDKGRDFLFELVKTYAVMNP